MKSKTKKEMKEMKDCETVFSHLKVNNMDEFKLYKPLATPPGSGGSEAISKSDIAREPNKAESNLKNR